MGASHEATPLPDGDRTATEHLTRMSSHHTMLLLAYTVMILLIAYRLADTYLGGAYVCPRCGAREAGRHSVDCPWAQ